MRITLLNNDNNERWLIDDLQVRGTAASPTTPTITTSPLTPAGSFTTPQGTASVAKSYTLTGTNLTADATVTPPVGYEVSQTSATAGFAGDATAITVPQANASATAGQTIYVRLTGAATGTFAGNVTNASTGATTVNVAVTGTVTAAATAPVLTTTAVSAITQTTATTGGNISSNGGDAVTVRGVVYGTSANPRIGGTGVTNVPDAMGGSGSFNSNLTGLTASTTYYVAAYATNGVGTTYGVDVSFMTLAGPVTPLLGYDFTSGATPSTQDANVTGTSFVRVNVGPNAGFGRFNSNGWPASSISNSDYITFSFNPNTGYEADLTSLNFVDQRSAGTAGAYEVRVSSDGFATYTTLLTGTTTGGSKSATLNGFTGIMSGTTIEFRFYYANSGTYSVDDVNLSGTVSAVVPGPRITLVQNEGGATASTDVPQNGNYAFPTTALAASTVQTFYIKNVGTTVLTLTGPMPVTLSGSTDFTITQQPTATSVAVGDSTNFLVSFAPSSPVPATATINVASNDTPRSPYTFTVTGQTPQPFNALRWDGGANTSSWNDAANWVGNVRPTTSSNVLLDHKFVTGAYNVTLGSSSQTTVSSLSIKPGGGPAIGMTITTANTATTPILFTNSAVGDTALAIYSGGLLRNQSGAGTGGAGIEAQGSNPTVYILNGGAYRHETVRAHKNLVDNLAPTADTRTGTFVFAIPTPVGAGSTIASSNAYGNLTLSDGTIGSGGYTYNLGGATNVRGTLTVDNTAALAMNDNLTVGGDLVLNGVTRLTATAPRTLLLNGTKAQTISGGALGAVSTTASNLSNAVTLEVANAAGLALNTPVRVNGTLALTSGLITTTATNLLTVVCNPTGGSATSYVNGPLARITTSGAASSVFPIGKSGVYRPLTLNTASQSAARTYVAEQFNSSARTTALTGPSSGAASAAALLTRVSNIRYFTLAPLAATGTFSGTATLSFEADDFVNYPADLSFVVAKRADNTSAWGNFGRSSSTGTANGGQPVSGTLTSGPITSFSDFALASTADASNNALNTSNPLPVELTAFTAQRQPDGSGVTLKWATATERNSARFEVQRSTTGREFSTVATVLAAGTSSQSTIYASLDKEAPATTLYYRLRQVDRDGTFAFSPVATVAGSGVAGKVLLFPNPAQHAISFIAATPTPYRVLSQLGQSLLSGTAEAGTASIRIEKLPAGLYFLELQTATGRTVQKFEKE